MVRINKIYTRTGDKGKTRLVGNAEVDKDCERVECLGEVDELNACLGVVLAAVRKTHNSDIQKKIELIQNELFDIGSELATPADAEYPGMLKATAEQVTRLETWIDEATKDLPELKSFVLPGGTDINAQLHLARTVCRRAERHIKRLSRSEPVQANLMAYINRLSDLLFALARSESARSQVPELLWVPGKDRSP